MTNINTEDVLDLILKTDERTVVLLIAAYFMTELYEDLKDLPLAYLKAMITESQYDKWWILLANYETPENILKLKQNGDIK